MEFEFELTRPAPPLAPYVESVWWARGQIPYRRERIAPTGSTVAVLVLGAPIVQVPRNGTGERFVAARGWLAGPHDEPVVNAPTAETWAVGVVCTPVGCRALFGADPAPLRGRVVDLESRWAAAGPLRRSLLGLTEPRAGTALVEDALRAGLRPHVRGMARCATVVAALEADPRRPIAAIAADLGVTHGHLDREFVRVVGLAPRALARILRLRRLLARIDVHAAVDWTALAAEWGWFDQSHFIRDFRRHTGVTPSGYVAAQRREFAAGQHEPGFVPER
ncbi:helix-turn-helix domain-containing protein [Pseudonocardia humida]|uniref:Helix-turn-helix transcriptional regulator n=1 Tax=Pseudonocardia humida TaxID=2800819 RepID=A0ABT0ZTX1_9PSEU|nr:AraC family transcriptional regulator [Pseudonocardia humida]MCO1654119.1 helix-turn-helix transcriptional regulator [Pseudonocardia humida]